MCADKHRDISNRVLGYDVNIPIGVAPSALQSGAHPRGEMATAEGKAFRRLMSRTWGAGEGVTNKCPSDIVYEFHEWVKMFACITKVKVKQGHG